MPREHDGRRQVKRIAGRTRLYLVLVIVFLAAIALGLAFKLGQAVWPAWMIAYRTQLIGVVLLFLLATIVASPIIVEVNSNPRHLSGPGHNPEQGPTERRMP